MPCYDTSVVIPEGSIRTRLICFVDAQNEKMLTDPKAFNICHTLRMLQSLNITFVVEVCEGM